MEYASRQTYKVVVVFEDRRKVLGSNVGAFRAARMAKQINAKGLTAEVTPNGGGDAVIYALED
jgi:hypothetical protein